MVCYRIYISKKTGEEVKYDRTESGKKYWQKNKERFTEKIICDCGGSYTLSNKSKHFKTKKHMNNN